MVMLIAKIRYAALMALILLVSVAAALAQASPAASGNSRRFGGETLKYDGKLNWMKISFSVADLTFTTTESLDGRTMQIRAEAVSKGTLTSLVHYSFVQEINSNVDLGEFRAARTEKHDVQKDRVRDSEAVFDYSQRRVTFVETDPKDKMRAPRRIASNISDPTHDIVSGIYFLRLVDMSVGKTFVIELSDSGLVYRIPVKVTAREKKSSILGKTYCWRVEPDIFGPGRLIEKEGKLVIWITADERRVPIAAKVDSGIGTMNVKLKEYKKAPTGQSAAYLNK